MDRLTTFCITHREPTIERRFYDHELALGDYGVGLPTHISRLDDYWHRMRHLSYSAAGSYAVGAALDAVKSSAEVVGLVMQRKFICRRPIGRPAPAFDALREVGSDAMAATAIEDARPTPAHPFLLSTPVPFRLGVIGQYAQAHRFPDMLNYLLIALELNVIDETDVSNFAMQTHLVPGGCEFGYFPRWWLIPTMAKLSLLGHVFLTRNAHRIEHYDRHQIRALSFLSERLSSFLLLKELTRRYGSSPPREIFGHMCVAVADGAAYSAAIATDADLTGI